MSFRLSFAQLCFYDFLAVILRLSLLLLLCFVLLLVLLFVVDGFIVYALKELMHGSPSDSISLGNLSVRKIGQLQKQVR